MPTEYEGSSHLLQIMCILCPWHGVSWEALELCCRAGLLVMLRSASLVTDVCCVNYAITRKLHADEGDDQWRQKNSPWGNFTLSLRAN